MQLPHKMAIVSSDVDLLAEISNNLNFGKAEEYRFYEPWLGQSLIVTSGARWKKLRKVITPAYHYHILANSMAIFQEQANVFVSKIKDAQGECVDAYKYLASYALDVIIQAAMGIEIGAQSGCISSSHQRYIKAAGEILRVIDQRILSPLCYFDWFWWCTPGYQKERGLIQVLHKFVDDVITARRKKLSSENNNDEGKLTDLDVSEEVAPKRSRKPLLDLLLAAEVDGQPLTDYDIRGEVNTATFAGHSSSTITTGFFLYCLAKHQDVQQKIVEEIEANIDDSAELTVNTLNSLRYLDMALKESMRIYTLAPIVGRRGTESLQFKDKTLPPDTTIYFLVNSIHMNPETYPEPEKYDPDRFLPEVAAKRHPYSFVPFSAGLRTCSGESIYLQQS